MSDIKRIGEELEALARERGLWPDDPSERFFGPPPVSMEEAEKILAARAAREKQLHEACDGT